MIGEILSANLSALDKASVLGINSPKIKIIKAFENAKFAIVSKFALGLMRFQCLQFINQVLYLKLY